MNKMTTLIITLLLFNSCMTRSQVMTRATFDEVSVGMDVNDILLVAGQPFKAYCGSGGTEEYVYIERVRLGQNVAFENHYIVVFQGNKVISKRITQERPPSYSIIYRDDPTLTQ